MISVQKEEIHDSIVVHIHGRVDAHSSKNLAETLESINGDFPNHHVIINFKNVEYISSSGLGLIVSLKRNVEKRGKKMKLVSINTAVKKVFKVLGMEKAFETYSSVNKALDSI